MKAFHLVACSLRIILIPICWIFFSQSILFASDFHVSPQGSDAQGDGSFSSPWASLQYACSQVPANQGHRILLSAGTFVERGGCKLSAGVSLVGAGIGNTVLTASSSFYRNYYSGFDANLFLLQLSEGNQLVEGITLEGGDKNIYGGIMVQNAQAVELRNLQIRGFFFTGLWLWNTQNSSFHHSAVYDCSWGSSAWAGGAIHVYKLKQVRLHDLELTEIQQRAGTKGGGLAIKALGPGSDNSLEEVHLYNCDISVNPYGVWQNGVAPNISVEFWNVEVRNCEMRNNTIRQHVSLVSITPAQSAPLSSGSYRVRLLQNQMLCEGSYPLEISMSNIEVAENYIDAGFTGYGIANWERRGTLYQNWYIHHNVFTHLGAGWPSSIIQTRGGLKSLRFENNTIHLEGPPIGIYSPYGPNTSEDIQIRRNVIIRTSQGGPVTEPAQDYLIYPKIHEGIHRLSQVQISENIFWGFTPALSPYITGLLQENNAEADPGLALTGKKPFPFYEPLGESLANQMQAGARLGRDTLDPTVPQPNEPKDTLIRINVGGEAFVSESGEYFMADDPSYLSGNSRTYLRSHPISGTKDDFLYQSERWGYEFGYHIPLPNGTYEVRLHFAEIYWKKAGIRAFNVNIEEGPVEVQDLDIFEEVGRFAAWVEEIPTVTVVDGVMDIGFSTQLNNAKLSALEIIGVVDEKAPSPIRINCGGGEPLRVGEVAFMADTFFSPNSLVWENKELQEVAKTDWDPIYTSERFAQEALGAFAYRIPVENGTYVLRVHFAEIYFGAEGGYPQSDGVGRRIMHVDIEGERNLEELDLARSVGSSAAWVFEKELRVTDQELHLQFSASKDRPKVSAIEVLPISEAYFVEDSLSQRKGEATHFFGEDLTEGYHPEPYVFPNPASQYTQIFLEGDEWDGTMEIVLTDGQGRRIHTQVFSKSPSTNSIYFPIQNLAPGMYGISIQNSLLKKYLKLLIK